MATDPEGADKSAGALRELGCLGRMQDAQEARDDIHVIAWLTSRIIARIPGTLGDGKHGGRPAARNPCGRGQTRTIRRCSAGDAAPGAVTPSHRSLAACCSVEVTARASLRVPAAPGSATD
jgi:hypothetical protein